VLALYEGQTIDFLTWNLWGRGCGTVPKLNRWSLQKAKPQSDGHPRLPGSGSQNSWFRKLSVPRVTTPFFGVWRAALFLPLSGPSMAFLIEFCDSPFGSPGLSSGAHFAVMQTGRDHVCTSVGKEF